MRNPIILCGECRKPRDFSSQGFCESKNREVDPDIANAMIVFFSSHPVGSGADAVYLLLLLRQPRNGFSSWSYYIKTVGFKFFAKIKITTKKEEADYCFFFLFMKIVLTIWQLPVCCTLISENVR